MSRFLHANNSEFLSLGSAVLTAYPMTIGCAYRSSANAFQGLVGVHFGGTARQYLYVNDSSFNYEAVIQSVEGGASGTIGSGVVGSITDWNFVVGAFDSATSRRISHNGSAIVTDTANVVISSTYTNTFIGKRGDGAYYFNGDIGHPFFFDVGLSNEEMIALSSGRISPLAIRPGHLVLYSPYLGRDATDIDIISTRAFTASLGAGLSAANPPMGWATSRRTPRIFVPPNYGGTSLRFRRPVGYNQAAADGSVLAKTGAYVASTPVQTYPISMAARARSFDTGAASHPMVISIGKSSDPFDRFTLGYQAGTNKINASRSNNVTTVDCPTTVGVSDSNWHHLGATFAAIDDTRSYLDGTNKGTSAGSVTLATANINMMAFGIILDLSYFPLDGNVAFPAVWAAALDDAEWAALAAGISPLAIRPQSLVFYVPDLGRDRQPIDIIGGRKLTVFGATPDEGPPQIRARGNRARVFRDLWPFDESLHPNAVTLTNLTGAYTDIDEDPSVKDGAWLLKP